LHASGTYSLLEEEAEQDALKHPKGALALQAEPPGCPNKKEQLVMSKGRWAN
jgi:hypothetical protein